jgi:hypothetical protein
MAIRRRQVHPDEILTLRGGDQVPVVSDEAFLGALLEVGRMVCFAGGVVTATVMRAPTDLEGERVTVGAVVEWKDRTDAREQAEPVVKPQPMTAEQGQEFDAALDAHLARPPEEYADDVDLEPQPGNGAAALPFQREEEPLSADAALAQVDEALKQAPLAEQEIKREHRIEPRVALEQSIAHEEGSSYRPVGPPAPASDDGIDDGLDVDPDAVDLSEIPEGMR